MFLNERWAIYNCSCTTADPNSVDKRFLAVGSSADDYDPSGDQVVTVPTTAVNGTMLNFTVFVIEDSIVENTEEIPVTLLPGLQYRLLNNASLLRNFVIVEDNDGA